MVQMGSYPFGDHGLFWPAGLYVSCLVCFHHLRFKPHFYAYCCPSCELSSLMIHFILSQYKKFWSASGFLFCVCLCVCVGINHSFVKLFRIFGFLVAMTLKPRFSTQTSRLCGHISCPSVTFIMVNQPPIHWIAFQTSLGLSLHVHYILLMKSRAS